MIHLTGPQAWGLASGAAGLAGYLPYLRAARRRHSDPDPAAWLVWAAEYALLLAAQVAQNPPLASLCLAGLQLAGTCAVLVVLATRGGWHLGLGRWLTLGCCAAVLAAWWFTSSAAAAMCLALAVEGTGVGLTVTRALRRPGSEPACAWWAFTVAGLLDLPALGPHAALVLYAYPVFFTLAGAVTAVSASAWRRDTGLLTTRPPGAAASPPRPLRRARQIPADDAQATAHQAH